MYDYQAQRANLFTEKGQRLFIAKRDGVFRVLDQAGAIRMSKVFDIPTGSGSDTWDILAVMDRMIELGDIREITGPNVAGQDRVFVRAREC